MATRHDSLTGSKSPTPAEPSIWQSLHISPRAIGTGWKTCLANVFRVITGIGFTSQGVTAGRRGLSLYERACALQPRRATTSAINNFFTRFYFHDFGQELEAFFRPQDSD
jgi:hypothetical protein